MYWSAALIACFLGLSFALPPTITPIFELVEKSTNGTHVATCIANNKDYPNWTGPNGKTFPMDVGRVHVENRAEFGRSLFFDRLTAEDSGTYSCTSTTGESAKFVLRVFAQAKFVNTPRQHQVNEFQSTLIRCETVGDPKPVITWWNNGQNLNNLPPIKYKVESKGLKILNTTKDDAGIFTCLAMQFGKVQAASENVTISLTVLHKPEWKYPVSSQTYAYGYMTGETNLTCEAVAEPYATYTWLRDNQDIKFFKINATIIKEPDRSILQIQVQNGTAFGNYQCQAKNKLGSISRMFNLTEGEKPEPPTAVKVTGTTLHTATLKVESKVADTDLQGYRVQFVFTRPGEEVSWAHPEYQDLPKTENGYYELLDLLEDTPYTVRVATRSSAGLSDYASTYQTLRTLKTGQVSTSSCERTIWAMKFLFTALLVLATVH